MRLSSMRTHDPATCDKLKLRSREAHGKAVEGFQGLFSAAVAIQVLKPLIHRVDAWKDCSHWAKLHDVSFCRIL